MSLKYDDILTTPGNPGKNSPVTLCLDLEIDTNGAFPSPERSGLDNICLVTLYLSNLGTTYCYGTREISDELSKKLAKRGDTYVTCKDEADLLSRVIRVIKANRPTCYRGDSVPADLTFLYSRARALGVDTDPQLPDLDTLFRDFDVPLSKKFDLPSNKVSCPIAEEAWRKYNIQRRKQ